MEKKFVSLLSNKSPSRNPYEICTYIGEFKKPTEPLNHTEYCAYQHQCNSSQNPKVLTLQDEIHKIHKRTEENIFIKPFRKRCKYQDRFTSCVVPQRTPAQLRLHSKMCENYLKLQQEIKEGVKNIGNLYSNHKSLIELKDPYPGLMVQKKNTAITEPYDDENLMPKLASPECSRELIYVPPKRILALKRPKSGIYVNETERPVFNAYDEICYSSYDPRILQDQIDGQNLKNIDLIPGKDTEDMWTWNVGLQKKSSELDRIYAESVIPKFECTNLELEVYEIPKDLDKTFSADIVFGTKAVQPQPPPRKKPRFRRPCEMACLYIAFVESFRVNADFWTSETLDNIIKMAEKLIKQCDQLNYKSEDSDYDIIPQIKERKASVNIKVHFSGPINKEPNIYKALSIYFSKYSACILCSSKLYLLILKRCKNFFYVYDPNGRAENCTRDFVKGKSASMAIHHVEHLVHFIVNISETNLGDEFKLYEIYLTSYGKVPDPLPKKPFPKEVHKQWAVVNESYAVIPGCNNGIFQPNTSAVDNPSMLISVMAILYSQIERANTWKPDQVDELIRLGTAYYKSLRRKLNLSDSQHVTISDLPDKYVLGTFKASIKKHPFVCTGTVTDLCKKFTDSLLTSGLQELLDNKYEAALVQIDNSVLGVWRDGELFYVYDSFRRGKAGQVLDPDDYRTQGTAILQIHATMESLLRTLFESSMKMRRGAKFFIHAINVGCIKPIMDGKQRKLRYPKLKLTPETYVQAFDNQVKDDAPEEGVQHKKEEKQTKSKKSKKLKDKLPKVCSIQTLDQKDREVAYSNFEIVEPMLDEIICEIVEQFPEPEINRPNLYKSAARVLLRSDKEYLENLKYMLTHDEDYDNVQMSVRTEPDEEAAIISLEEELQLPSNFQGLPDGTWIIMGLQSVNYLSEEQLKLTGLLSSIVTAALTAKYNISTWTNKLIDYALEAAKNFEKEFQTYQYVLGALLHKRIPKILLGDRTYQLKVKNVVKSDIQKSLRQVLIEALIYFNRLMVICQRFSCLIVKRYNFLYMFCGFPVDGVGFRKQAAGPGCVMRFVELDSLIRRIEFGCNPHSCDLSNYIVVPLKVWDITSDPKGRYRSWPKNIEQKMYKEALDEKSRIEGSKKSKMRFLEEELAKENLRIQNFEAELTSRFKTKPLSITSSEEASLQYRRSEIGDDEFDDEEESEEECIVRSKHTFSSATDSVVYDESRRIRPILYGYGMREKDLLFKIQGSKALDDRKKCFDDRFKPCVFASSFAILYAILKPLNEWTSHRVDQVITSSTLLFRDKTEDLSIVPEMILKSISVDDYIFDVLLRCYQDGGLIGKDVVRQLEWILYQNKYILLKTANCSYAIIKDEFYHLFDPYPSMALMEDTNKDKSKNKKEDVQKPISDNIYGERNTASWILFADLNSMIEYINKRACTKTWKEDRAYSFMVLEVMSFRKAPQNTFMIQLLTDMQSCNVSGEQETVICAQNESVAWLEHCLPIWSRLQRRNADGRHRGVAVSKFKNYDIELEQRLWSLWGNLHPQAPVFDDSTRGKQYLACCVLALCAACIYRLVDWTPQLLDSIVINGDLYLKQSLQTIKCKDHELRLEDLDVECSLDRIQFGVHIEMVAYGELYANPNYNRMNLAEALKYFFNNFQFGILQCHKKCLAIGFIPGADGGYFMFDCQSRDNPLFPNGQGSSYVLCTKYLQILLYCIVVTLNVPYYNVQFALHKVNLQDKSQETSQKKMKKKT